MLLNRFSLFMRIIIRFTGAQDYASQILTPSSICTRLMEDAECMETVPQSYSQEMTRHGRMEM